MRRHEPGVTERVRPNGSHHPVAPDHELRWCKARGLKVVLITNTLNASDLDVRSDWNRFGFAEIIDHVVTSYSTRWLKPHPAIFQRALSLVGVNPAEALMTGDELVADIQGAQEIGLKTIWIRSSEQVASGSRSPDAVIRSLAELPDTLEAWLG